MKDYIIPIIIAAMSSTALFGFIQFLISRHDHQKTIVSQSIDRIQLMLLLADYPKEVDEILMVARHYFIELKGNGFVKTLFSEWIKSQNINIPEWFKRVKNEKYNT